MKKNKITKVSKNKKTQFVKDDLKHNNQGFTKIDVLKKTTIDKKLKPSLATKKNKIDQELALKKSAISTRKPNKKLLKINSKITKNNSAKNPDLSKKNSKKNDANNIWNFIDWGKVNNFKDQEIHNFERLPAHFIPSTITKKKFPHKPNLLNKLKNQIDENRAKICPVSYAKNRVEKYIENRRKNHSYNLHNFSLSRRVKNESLLGAHKNNKKIH